MSENWLLRLTATSAQQKKGAGLQRLVLQEMVLMVLIASVQGACVVDVASHAGLAAAGLELVKTGEGHACVVFVLGIVFACLNSIIYYLVKKYVIVCWN